MLPVLQRRLGLTAALLLGSVANAQEISGFVNEPGVSASVAGLAVADAAVKLEKASPGNDPDISVASMHTDGRGAFRFKATVFGTYRVSAAKEGFTSNSSGPGNFAEVILDPEHPTTELHFVLVHPAQITGRLIDKDTGRPISGLPISAAALFYFEGRRMATPRVTTWTGPEGQFILAGLPPGNYLISNGPRTNGAFETLTQFSKRDLEIVDQQYEWGFWPGGPDLPSALPVSVGSRQSVDVGTIELRHTAAYRVQASLPANDCAPGEMVGVTEFTLFGSTKNISNMGIVPCGGEFLARSFQPGTYWFGWIDKQDKLNLTKFEVRDRNLDLTLLKDRGMDIEGRIVSAEGSAKPPLARIEIQFVNAGTRFTLNGSVEPAKPDTNGKFQIENVETGSWRVRVSAPPGFYAKEIRYNEVAVRDGVIVVDKPGPLEVVLDDKAAALRGIAADDNGAARQPLVVLGKWPLSSENVFLSLTAATGDTKGEFRFLGLAPGAYRILAVSEGAREKLQEPGVLMRLLSRADTILLQPGGVQELRLDLADPTR